MKIRIKGNSIRLRLTRTEVEKFRNDGFLEEITEFGNTDFFYALQAREEISTLEASFNNGVMTMYAPEFIRKEWADNETVGYDHKMDIGDGKSLYLLLEKDFKCIDAAVTEDQTDNYEHPTGGCE